MKFVKFQGMMNSYEASLLKMKIIDVYGDGNKQLIGQEFYCLKSIQIQQNKYNKTKLKYDIHGCDYSNSCDGVVSSLQQQMQYPMVGISNEDLYIGRSNTNHIVLSDLSISKQHAIVTYDTHFGCFIKDLNSKHGTYINDDRITSDESMNSRIGAIDIDTTHINEDKYKLDIEHKSDIGDGDDDDPTEQHERSGINSCNNKIVIEQRQALRIGMIVRFGRIVCEVFRKQQNQIITSGFQPFNNNKPIAKADSCLTKSSCHVDTVSMDTTTQHKLAVTQRLQALLTTTHPLPISLFNPTLTLSNSRKDRGNDSNTASIKGKRSRNGMSLDSRTDDKVKGNHNKNDNNSNNNDNNNDNNDNNSNDSNNNNNNNDRGDIKLSNKYHHVFDACIDKTNANIESSNKHHQQQHQNSYSALNVNYSDQLHSSTGMDLLTKMGWSHGRALGKHDVSAPELIIPEQRIERLGIGHSSSSSNSYSNDVNHHHRDRRDHHHHLYMKSSDGDSERLKIWKRMIGRYHHHT